MNKVLRRRSAALAVAALAAALLLPQVAGALPGAGGQGARPAAQAAVGAAQGAGATGQAASAGPDLPCRGGLSASQADRQAQQLASQRGSNSTSQVVPQSNCCPIGCPPPPPPQTTCSLWINNPRAGVGIVFASGGVECTGSTPVSISLIVTLYKQRTGDPNTFDEIAREKNTFYSERSVSLTAEKIGCESTRYFAVAQATVNKPPSQDLGKRTSAIVSITCP